MNDLMTYYSNFNKVSYYNNPSNNQYDNCNYFQNDNYSDKNYNNSNNNNQNNNDKNNINKKIYKILRGFNSGIKREISKSN